MGAKKYAYINPNMLKWAREDIPLNMEDVCVMNKNIDLSVLNKWENGEEYPSISEAKMLAKFYDIPFAGLYLPSVPPHTAKNIVDRRTTKETDSYFMTYELWKEIRHFNNCRENMLEVIDEESVVKDIPIVENDSIDSIASIIRDFLELKTPLKNKTAFGGSVFNYYRKLFESKGILVFQINGINVNEIRGLSMNYDRFPIVVVNSKDSDKGKVFTLFHEIAHIVRRTSALCSIDFSEKNDNEEKICDAIAGKALVLKDSLKEMDIIDDDNIAKMAERYGVSTFVILKRLYDEKMISNVFYREKYEEYYNNFMLIKDFIKKEKEDFRIPMHTKFISTNGNLYPATILNAYYENRISLGEVCGILNLKTKHISELERSVVLYE